MHMHICSLEIAENFQIICHGRQSSKVRVPNMLRLTHKNANLLKRLIAIASLAWASGHGITSFDAKKFRYMLLYGP